MDHVGDRAEERAPAPAPFDGQSTPAGPAVSLRRPASAPPGEASVPRRAGGRLRPLLRPVIFGLLAATALLAFYLGVITLAQGSSHALEQLGIDRWFVGAIVLGFSTQIGLFTYLRGLHARAATSGVAVSSGTSTAAMLACCAHHLTDILPIVGLSGAAIFLNAYKTPLLWLGIIMNLAGILYLARKIREQRRQSHDAIRPVWLG